MKNQTLNEKNVWLDGKQANEVNKLAKEYILLTNLIAEKTAELDDIKEKLKSLNNGEIVSNTFETNNYIVPLVARKGSSRVDKKVFEKLYPQAFNDDKIWIQGSITLTMGKVVAKV